MFCPKCNGIEEVINIHDSGNIESRLCDVKCLQCGYVSYFRPYDYGAVINLIPDLDTKKEE